MLCLSIVVGWLRIFTFFLFLELLRGVGVVEMEELNYSFLIRAANLSNFNFVHENRAQLHKMN